jgi:hypothetical protein
MGCPASEGGYTSATTRRGSQIATHHVTRHYTPIHNILSTAPQLSISQKALGTLPEDGNVMPKHVGDGRKWVFMTAVTQLYLGKPWKQLHVSALIEWVIVRLKTRWPTKLGAETCSCFQGFPKYGCVTTVINTHFLPALKHRTGMTSLKMSELPYIINKLNE